MQNPSTFDLRPPEPLHEDCPSCGVELVPKQKECFSCGVVFASFAKFQFEKIIKQKVGGIDHLTQGTLQQLDLLWKKIVVNYHDQESHQAFLRRCFVESAIPFAVHCYTRMLDIDKEDDLAITMRRQALQMLALPWRRGPISCLPFRKIRSFAGL